MMFCATPQSGRNNGRHNERQWKGTESERHQDVRVVDDQRALTVRSDRGMPTPLGALETADQIDVAVPIERGEDITEFVISETVAEQRDLAGRVVTLRRDDVVGDPLRLVSVIDRAERVDTASNQACLEVILAAAIAGGTINAIAAHAIADAGIGVVGHGEASS
jgi:hypothetical protein